MKALDKETVLEMRKESDLSLVRSHELLRDALTDMYWQTYGVRNTWCGCWIKCRKCLRSYAQGGNWGANQECCPFCWAKKVLGI